MSRLSVAQTELCRAVAQGHFKPRHVTEALDALHRAATWTHPETGKGDAAALKLLLGYMLGSPRHAVSGMVQGVDVRSLDTPEKCLAATEDILRLQLSGELSADEAQALRDSVRLALQALGAGEQDKPTDSRPVQVVVNTYDQAGANLDVEDL